MRTKNTLYAAAIASSFLFAAHSGHAAPAIYDNLIDFNAALGSHGLEVEDFETLGLYQPSPFDMGDFIMESAYDLQGSSSHGTNGSKSLRISEHEDFWVKFTFDSPIQAFRIDAIDALDTGGGDIDVTVDGDTFKFLDDVALPNENVLFIGIIDWAGFTTVKIDGSDDQDKIYYDNLQYSSEFVVQELEQEPQPEQQPTTESATAVPEPGTLATFGLTLAGFGFMRRRRAA